MAVEKEKWLSVLCIFLTAIVGFWVVYPVHIPISYFETDFLDYCIGIEAFEDIKLRAPYKRSSFAALLPYVFSKPLGIINGIAVASLCCYVGVLIVSARWVFEFTRSWTSVWVTSALFIMMGPVLSLSRMLNFYPEIILTLLLSSYIVYKAASKPTWVTCSAAGLAIAASCMVDVRGLVWGLWFVILMIGVLIRTPRLLNIIAFSAALGTGWFGGVGAYHRHHSPLSRQLDVRPLYLKLDPNNPLYAEPHAYPEGFLWGRSGLEALRDEVIFLIDQAFLPTPEQFYTFTTVSEGVQRYWMVWGIIALCSTIILLYKKEKASIYTILALLPFGYVYWKLPDVVEPHIRFYAQAMPALLIIIAAAIYPFFQERKKFILGALMLVGIGLSTYWVPKWGVSRVILNAHVEMSIPEAKKIYKDNELIRGYEVHLYVSPITKKEVFLQSTWYDYCNTRLKKDNVIVPFYQTLSHE